jgi:nucleoside-diphosphate-sugar epimerase
MSKRILLTGGTGFLGSHILKACINNGDEVVLIKRRSSSINRIKKNIATVKMYDLEDISLEDVLLQNKIDIIIHFATSYGKNGETLSDISFVNVDFPSKLLDAAIKTNVSCFINTDTSLPAEVNHYAFTKKQFLAYLKSKSDQINIVNMAPEYFYGPGDDNWKLVTMIIQKLVQKAPVIEFTDGLQQRDFIYISDVVNAYLTVLDNNEKLKGWNEFSVSSGQTVSIRELAERCKIVCNNTSTYLAFGALKNRQNDLLHSSGNNYSLRKLGWDLQIELSEGIALTRNELINN